MFYKCADCWRLYSELVVNSGHFTGCKCQCIRFRSKRETNWIKVKAWLSKWI